MATDYSVFGPFAGAAFAGYDRGHEDRVRRQTQNALADYNTNPDQAITNYMAVDAPSAIKFLQSKAAADAENAQRRAMAVKAMSDAAGERQKLALSALAGATTSLRAIRDKGGDVGAGFDQLDQAGILDTMGMTPQEKAQYRAAITTNPAILDAIAARVPEGVVIDHNLVDKNTGNIMRTVPRAPEFKIIPNGTGGSSYGVYDPNTGGFGNGAAPAPATGGVPPAIAAPTGNSAGASRGDRNGNPGNLKDGPFARSQPGYIGSDGTFAKFAPGAGILAQENLLRSRYFGRGINTVNGIVDTYLGAGNDENSAASRQNYKNYVAGRLGIDPSQPIPPSRLRDVGQAMREFETGNTSRSASPAAPQSSAAPAVPGFTILGQTAPRPAKAQPKRMTAQEVAAEGLDPSIVYYRNADGVPTAVSGQTKPNAQLKPWPQTALKSYSENRASIQNIDNALSLLDPKNNSPEAKAARGATGFGTGALGDYFTNNISDPKGTSFRALIGQIGGIIIKDISGAAVSATEDARLAKWVPKVTDSPQTIRDKLNNLKREINQRNSAMEDTFTEDQGYRPRTGGARAPVGAAPAAPSAASAAPVRVRTVQQAMALPPGTVFITPDGRRKVR